MKQELWDFGRKLIDANDLDPVYVLLHRAKLEPVRLRRFLLAYWCFYHVGVASKLSTAENWTELGKEIQVRGAERRHFRGAKAIAALDWLAINGSDWFDSIYQCTTFQEVSTVATRPPLFGPWIAFKIGDMLERLVLAPISFDDCELLMYQEPANGAALVIHGGSYLYTTPSEMRELIRETTVKFNEWGYKAPPTHDRPIGLQEVETMLCKFKSHKNGHYPVGKDVREVTHALEEWESDLVKWLPL